jgi:hypothetical protein
MSNSAEDVMLPAPRFTLAIVALHYVPQISMLQQGVIDPMISMTEILNQWWVDLGRRRTTDTCWGLIMIILISPIISGLLGPGSRGTEAETNL